VCFLKDDSKEHWNLEGASRNTTRLMMEDMAAQPRDLLLHIGTPRRRSSSRLIAATDPFLLGRSSLSLTATRAAVLFHLCTGDIAYAVGYSAQWDEFHDMVREFNPPPQGWGLASVLTASRAGFGCRWSLWRRSCRT
jgi:hypothetical protein